MRALFASTQPRRAALVGIMLVGFLLIPHVTAESAELRVVISEVLWMGSDASTADEWVEIAAVGIDSRSLSGWTLTSRNASGQESVIVKFPSSFSIRGGESLVISNWSADRSRLLNSPALVTTSLTLPNTKLLLRLRDENGHIVDEVDDGIGDPFAGINTATKKASMERIDLTGSGALKSNWRSAEVQRGFDDGTVMFGTPGFANGSIGESIITISSPSSSSASSSSEQSHSLAILLQSGTTEGIGHVTPNFQAVDANGKALTTGCSWDFGDGKTSNSCNPPPHAFPDSGEYLVIVRWCADQPSCLNVSVAMLTVKVQPDPLNDEGEISSCTPVSGTGVWISEVMPNPVGDEEGEWFELRNDGYGDIDLCGWSVHDKSGKKFSLNGYRLKRRSWAVFPKRVSHLSLNNGEEVLELRFDDGSEDGRIMQRLSYLDAEEGHTLNLRDDALLVWSPYPTPGNPNIFRSMNHGLMPGFVIIGSSMPNPPGSDTATEEWITLKNLTNIRQDLTGTVLTNEKGTKKYPLDGLKLWPQEERKISAKELSFTLQNTIDEVHLLNEDGYTLSVLHWEHTESGQTVTHPLLIEKDSEDESKNILEKCGIKMYGEKIYGSLSIDENFDQIFNSTNEENSIFPHQIGLNQYIKCSNMIRSGFVYVDEYRPSRYQDEFRAFESDAREDRIGIWADEDRVERILAEKKVDRERFVVARDGVQITLDPLPSVLEKGSVVRIMSNVPSEISVSVNSGAWIASSGSLVIDDDVSLKIHARAVVRWDGSAIPKNASTVLDAFYPVLRGDYDQTLAISEVMPSGSDDWVEIVNRGSNPMPISGWSIDDVRNGGSKTFVFSGNAILAPGEILFVPKEVSRVAWNDNGDDVRLIDPRGIQRDNLTYTRVKKGQSIVRALPMTNRLCFTDVPTPNDLNICVHLLPAKIASDSDGDFIFDDRELYVSHTDPLNPDSDGDGWIDGFELQAGLNPLRKDAHDRNVARAYRDYVRDRVKLKWKLFTRKGLTVSAKKSPFDVEIAGSFLPSNMTMREAGKTSVEAIVPTRVAAGNHMLDAIVTDAIGNRIHLPNMLAIVLAKDYPGIARRPHRGPGVLFQNHSSSFAAASNPRSASGAFPWASDPAPGRSLLKEETWIDGILTGVKVTAIFLLSLLLLVLLYVVW